jgi:hypothetical protein
MVILSIMLIMLFRLFVAKLVISLFLFRICQTIISLSNLFEGLICSRCVILIGVIFESKLAFKSKSKIIPFYRLF